MTTRIHASEPPDLELIDDALQHGAHRIGHGVRLRKEITTRAEGSLALGPLARYVYDHQIPLEMAPTCHVHVGAVPDLASHPIGAMLRHGFNVSVNTDNRLMSGVMPSSEVLAVATTFDLTTAEIEQLVVNGVMAGFAPLETRRQIVEQQVRPASRYRLTGWVAQLCDGRARQCPGTVRDNSSPGLRVNCSVGIVSTGVWWDGGKWTSGRSRLSG